MSHATITFEKNRDKAQLAAAACDARTHPNPKKIFFLLTHR